MKNKHILPPDEATLYENIQLGHRQSSSLEDGHPTASAFVINPERNKILMIYHRKYDSWGWMGGHVMKDESILDASIRELEEESGLSRKSPYSSHPISVEKLWAFDHYHYNVTFLFVVDEDEDLILNERETKGIRWIKIEEMDQIVSEQHMLVIYHKILERISKLDFDIDR